MYQSPLEGPRPAEPLMLIPGFMCDVRLWGPQVEALSAEMPLILPAWGRAETVGEAAAAALAAAPERFAVAGHGLGGCVAIEMLRQAGARITRIALSATFCLAETPSVAAERELRMARVKAGLLDAVVAEDVPEDALAPGPLRAPLRDCLAEMARGLGEGTYLRQARAMQRRPDQQRTLRQARLPALVLGGAADTICRPQRLDFLAGLMPNAQLEIVAGAGHVPMLERPDAVTDALRAWLARTPAPVLLNPSRAAAQ
ncbi:alpha/beta fold hydrolase [Rhodobacteraceae bacterium CCMM004]|nr:alpha/beta fold hydrolase [Rhodobacteraceae bacterium CCMM004]